MRHRKIGRRLKRSQSHRQALLKNLSKELLRYEQITTTLPKAKELKRYIDKIITLGKKSGQHRKRQAFALLRDDILVTKVFDVLANRYKTRAGGYSRVLKMGFRSGDAAPMAVIELVDRDETAKLKPTPVVEDVNKQADTVIASEENSKVNKKSLDSSDAEKSTKTKGKPARKSTEKKIKK